jgi:hypothetical protein
VQLCWVRESMTLMHCLISFRDVHNAIDGPGWGEQFGHHYAVMVVESGLFERSGIGRIDGASQRNYLEQAFYGGAWEAVTNSTEKSDAKSAVNGIR